MTWNNLILEKDGSVAVLTINRPKVLNSLNDDTVHELGEAMGKLERDDEVAVIIITGAGDRAFVAGGDVAFMQNLSPMEARDFAVMGQRVLTNIENLSKPVIAAVNGFALGGGCELAMACDIRVASEKAKFGQPEVTLGIMAGFGGTQRLPRLVNIALAKEILFTADIIDVEKARDIGLVNHVVPAEQLIDFCKDLARRIASRGPVAVRLTKEAINAGTQMDLERALALEADLFALTFTTRDRAEGMGAFLEKRRAQFTGA